jgi:hypothetical protein
LKLSQKKLNEYRRIKYNQKNRELKKEETETLTHFINNYKMGWKDQLGYDFEIKEVLSKLEEAGLGEYIKYHNPIDPFEWTHTKTVGVDLKLEIGDNKLFVEVGYRSKPYYRRKWFVRDRLPRFEGLPAPSEKVLWILLTNDPENFRGVKELASEYSISILSIDDLLSLISKLTISNNQLTNY